MKVTCNGTIVWVPAPMGPWGGARRSNIIKSQSQSQFQRFLTKLCVRLLTNERYKTYQTGFLLCRLGQAPGWDLRVPVGLGVNFIFRNSTRFGV